MHRPPQDEPFATAQPGLEDAPRRRMLPWVVAGAVFVAAGLGAGGWFLLGGTKGAPTPEGGPPQPAGSACSAPERPEDLGNDHLEPGETFNAYSSDPPTSGPHAPTPTETGQIYHEEQPEEQLVHAMEHGAVVIWTNFENEGPRKRAEAAAVDLYEQGYESLIVTPKPDMDTPLAMTAWGTLQTCVRVDPADMRAFVEAHYGSGLEGSLACAGEAADLPGCTRAG